MKNLSKKYILNLCGIGLIALMLGACSGGSAAPTPNTFCSSNVANFSSVAGLSLIVTPTGDLEWGPNLANLPLPESLATCQSSLSWNESRVIAATAVWVAAKVNYCHHHVPTWYPETAAGFAACESSPSVVSSPTGIIRWNYTGVAPESNGNWYTFDTHLNYGVGNYGYGLDCSDYSKLIYSYAESIVFTSGINLQAGQNLNESNLAPNMSGFVDSTATDPLGLSAAGQLVCSDGTVAIRGANSSGCNGHGGYISVFAADGTYQESAITDTMLNNLQPGDLLYIAGCGSNPNAATSEVCGFEPSQNVTHVVIWTGQKIGQSSSISESMIAPETDTDDYGDNHGQCSNHDWWTASNNVGNWIITDSHYQGPDYRAFTNCFYRNQVWGVRRVLNDSN